MDQASFSVLHARVGMGHPNLKSRIVFLNKFSGLRYIIITIYGIWIAYYCIPQFLGSLGADVAWLLADFSGVFNIICTVTILFVLRKEVFRLGNDFFERFLPAKERGENPEPVVYEEVA